MDWLIRSATVDDADVIVDLNCRLASETESLELERAVVHVGVRAALSDTAKSLYFVAIRGDAIIGQTMVTYEWSDWRNGWIWWIQSVYVLAEYRGRGVFRSLHQHVETSARRANAVGLRLYVRDDNQSAQQVYQRMGMHRAGYHVLEQIF